MLLFMFSPNTKRRKLRCLSEVLLMFWYFNQLRWGWRHLSLRPFGKTYLFIGNCSLSAMSTKKNWNVMAIKLDLWHSPCGVTVMAALTVSARVVVQIVHLWLAKWIAVSWSYAHVTVLICIRKKVTLLWFKRMNIKTYS